MRILLVVLLLMVHSVTLASETTHKYLFGTRVVIKENCPISGGGQETGLLAAALLTSILPGIIDKAVDWTAAAAKAAGEAHTSPAETGTGFTSMLTTDGKGAVELKKGFGCIIVTSADFGLDDQNKPSGTFKTSAFDNFLFAHNPRFYIEMTVVKSPDGNFFALKPAFLYFREPSESSIFSGTRDLNLSLSFVSAAEKDPFASLNLNFKGLKPNTEVNLISTKAPMTSGYLPVPPLNDVMKSIVESETVEVTMHNKELKAQRDAKKAIEEGKKAGETLEKFHSLTTETERQMAMGYQPIYAQKLKAVCETAQKVKKRLEHCPDELFWANEELRFVAQQSQAILEGDAASKISTSNKTTEASDPHLLDATNIVATLVESRDGNKFMKLVGEILEGSKADLKKNITSTLPSEREKAIEAKETSQIDMQILAAEKLAEVRKLETEIIVETDPVKLSVLEGSLLVAKMKANQAYKNAGKTPPFAVSL